MNDIHEPVSSGHSHSEPWWESLLSGIDPAWCLAKIRLHLRGIDSASIDPEDVWSETLWLGWRDRQQFSGKTPEQFASWLMGIARHRISNSIDHLRAQSRGGGMRRLWMDGPIVVGPAGETRLGFEPAYSTTPSRVASHRERADIIVRAIDDLPRDLRDVVMARAIEDLDTNETSQRLDVGVSAVKHRFRRGLEMLYRSLRRSGADDSRVSVENS